jgi:tRNA1Val (adenine37-N6)-methyltransferase
MRHGSKDGVALTEDSLFDGAVRFFQPASGYRVNIDSLLLAAFAARGRHPKLSVDLGAGVGAVSLALAHLGVRGRLELVEKEPMLADLARKNLARARLAAAVHVLDLERDGLPRALVGHAELVVANPPYFEPGTARRRRRTDQSSARSGSLAPFLAAASRALSGKTGRIAFVYPARALASLLLSASGHSLVPKRLRLVHARLDRPARLALVELRRAREGGLEVEPPLVEWSSPGQRSPELAELVKLRAADRR